MNPYSIEIATVSALESRVGLPVYPALRMGERQRPFLLLEAIPVGLIVKGNETWEYTVRLTYTANAHDCPREQFCTTFSRVVTVVSSLKARSLNFSSPDFYPYLFRLDQIGELQASEDDFSQSCDCRLVVQF